MNYNSYIPLRNETMHSAMIFMVAIVFLVTIFIIPKLSPKYLVLYTNSKYRLLYIVAIIALSYKSIPLALVLMTSFCIGMAMTYTNSSKLVIIDRIKQQTQVTNKLNIEMMNKMLINPEVTEKHKISILEKILASEASPNLKYRSAMILCNSKNKMLKQSAVNMMKNQAQNFNEKNVIGMYKGMVRFMGCDEMVDELKKALKSNYSETTKQELAQLFLFELSRSNNCTQYFDDLKSSLGENQMEIINKAYNIIRYY